MCEAPQQALAVPFKLISVYQLPGHTALTPCPAREEHCCSKVEVCPRFGQGRVNFFTAADSVPCHITDRYGSKGPAHSSRAGKSGVWGESWLILCPVFPV